jgi:hypothetical protein
MRNVEVPLSDFLRFKRNAKLALCLLLLCLSGIGLTAAWKSDADKIHFVEFTNAQGERQLYGLGQPVSRGDALALRSEIFAVAQKEQQKGNDAFLRAFTEGGSYTDSGSICYITSRSGGRVYYCGSCSGLGCAQVKAIQ